MRFRSAILLILLGMTMVCGAANVERAIYLGANVSASEAPVPQTREPQPVAPRHIVIPERHLVQLEWDARPGEVYTVERDGMAPVTVTEGWFEDAAPVSGAEMTYTVSARCLGSRAKADSTVTVAVPELPLPSPPVTVRAATRANRIVLGWDSDSTIAAQYYILKHNESGEVIEATYIDADFGHYLQVSDQVSGGMVYTYTVAAVAPDGRIGPASEAVQVVSSTEPLEPLVQLSFEDESFLEGLAELTERGIVLGGKGWAELPIEPNWNPDHALSLSVWVKLDDAERMPVLICKGAWRQAGYFLQVYQQRVRFYLAGVGVLDAGRPKPQKWQHIVATYGFGQLRVYINGEQVGRNNVRGRPLSSDAPVLVGRYSDDDDAYFVRGILDDVRIYDVPLTPGEVKALYDETKRN